MKPIKKDVGIFTNADKEKLICILTENLPVLRARLGLSQEDVSKDCSVVDKVRTTKGIV